MEVLTYVFFLVNFIAFFLIACDKRLAIRNKNRIPEKTLLLWVALGGTIGSSLAMSIFRHKTSKTSYLWKFFGIITLQVFILLGVFYLNLISL
ncbi:DUF1294 domain-containing protein [Flavobacterium aestivum]|uniref:DUF1294 domain-containing protein n=1 Tax=Flavobacterium aestivum TaxID=3003257 RepID=UPI002482C158|nr:DUF1294 domain-containing protein [Flavobacterium aestivum]